MFRHPRARALRLRSAALLLGAALGPSAAFAQRAPGLGPSPSRVPTAPTFVTPAFEPAPCARPLPADATEGRDVRCGTVTVPEIHDRPGGRPQRLSVVVFAGENPTPRPDPVVYLGGGPGEKLDTILPLFTRDFRRTFTRDRALVLFDPRGVGRSTPNLDCPEFTTPAAIAESLTLSSEASLRQFVTLGRTCRDRLQASGANLGAYTSVQSAGDVDAIRRALGARTINVYGVSYGSRLALEVARRFPASVRSLVLDAAVSPDTDYLGSAVSATSRALRLSLARCAADASCGRAFPGLLPRLLALTNRLDRDRPTVRVTDPRDGKGYDVALDAETFVAAVTLLLYSGELAPQLPAVLDLADRGVFEPITSVLSASLAVSDGISQGARLSVLCNETVTLPPARTDASVLPPVRAALQPTVDAYRDLCRTWGSGSPDPRSQEPVRSAVPTLVLAGALDPVTPPDFARAVVRTLPRARLVTFAGGAHGQLLPGEVGECARTLVAAFVTDPAARPDASCADAVRPYLVPPAGER